MYVDDILGIGNPKTGEKVIRNTRRLEEEFMVIKSGNRKNEAIKESVKDGIIERTYEYNYTRLRVEMVIW